MTEIVRNFFTKNLTKKSDSKAEIGALWVYRDKNGNDYYSAKIKVKGEDVNIKFFRNGNKKEGSNQPDYRAYKG